MIRVENPSGGISATVTASPGLNVVATSATRKVTADDYAVTNHGGMVLVEATPADDARIDLSVELPYGSALQARTKSGPIAAHGFFGQAELITESGDVTLEAPWHASRLRLTALAKPAEVFLPDGVDFATYEVDEKNQTAWVMEDRLPDMRITYGRIRVNAGETPRLTVRQIPIPEDSLVKLPWQARDVLKELLAQKKKDAAEPDSPATASTGGSGQGKQTSFAAEGEALFSSSVRMVSLTAAVYDKDGRPMSGLEAGDFSVLDNGIAQKIASAGAEEVPFNLVLLLDLSGSTKQNREEMKAAALRFLGIARPQDRVAVYALANDRFHVVSPLTDDREQLRRLIPALPEVSGGTPLYDALTLAYAQELKNHPGERNAIIVISDGVDNQIHGQLTPSKISFHKLRKAARQFDALVYPILLDAAEPGKKAKGWEKRARKRMEELAAATGGRLFPARSLQELEPVYPQVENELRAVYTIAYYPKDQSFDGSWHEVEIKTDDPRAVVRCREGYVASP